VHPIHEPRRTPSTDSSGRRNGTTNAILAAHRVTANMVTNLIRDGLAIAMTQQVRAGARMIEIVRARITAARQRTIEGQALE
jgi:hypothetical protein